VEAHGGCRAADFLRAEEEGEAHRSMGGGGVPATQRRSRNSGAGLGELNQQMERWRRLGAVGR
jgi:hypothetical protein